MATLQIDKEQTDALRQTLWQTLSGLRFEIDHTDHADFRDMLKRRRRVLEQLLAQVADASHSGIGA